MTSAGVEEPAKFSEPALYLIRPDGSLYFGSVQIMPFARPHFAEIFTAIDLQPSHIDYPGSIPEREKHRDGEEKSCFPYRRAATNSNGDRIMVRRGNVGRAAGAAARWSIIQDGANRQRNLSSPRNDDLLSCGGRRPGAKGMRERPWRTARSGGAGDRHVRNRISSAP
jgi:hypothetical protein